MTCPSSDHWALMAALISGALAASVGLILGGELAVLQRRYSIVCRLIVVLDERFDLAPKVAGQEVIFE